MPGKFHNSHANANKIQQISMGNLEKRKWSWEYSIIKKLRKWECRETTLIATSDERDGAAVEARSEEHSYIET